MNIPQALAESLHDQLKTPGHTPTKPEQRQNHWHYHYTFDQAPEITSATLLIDHHNTTLQIYNHKKITHTTHPHEDPDSIPKITRRIHRSTNAWNRAARIAKTIAKTTTPKLLHSTTTPTRYSPSWTTIHLHAPQNTEPAIAASITVRQHHTIIKTPAHYIQIPHHSPITPQDLTQLLQEAQQLLTQYGPSMGITGIPT